MNFSSIKENLDKLDVLSEIYSDLNKSTYPNRKEMDIAKLKMKLVKKELLLLNYMINKEFSR